MKKINILSDETIIKIAAGEVIENPASIVKELVENSIDAGSDKIIIELQGNGSDLIRITDNGEGISADDLEIAFKRHTTSKISNIDDLEETLTLGFRGEALSSVAAVSDVEIITKTSESDTGIYAKIDNNGDVIEFKEIVTQSGTSLSCHNLFMNMPVRRSYLENKNYEINKTNDIINRLALSNPNVSMEYFKDSNLVVKTNKNRDLLSNIYSVLGNSVGNNLIYIEKLGMDISIRGYISNNVLFKGNRNHQYLFVNNRTIYDSDLGRTIEKSYSSIIPLNRYPVFVLYIDINPKFLDVNIHPKKSMIKILNSDDLKGRVDSMIKDALSSNLLIPSYTENKLFVKPTIFDEKDEKSFFDPIKKAIDEGENKKLVEVRDYSVNYPDDEEIELKAYVKEVEDSKIILFPNGYRFIGNLFLKYLLLEDNNDQVLYVLDQHAIHERINYEKLVKEYRNNKIISQRLLSGYVIEFTRNEFERILLLKDNLNNLGIEIEDFGDNSIIVRSLPIVFADSSPEKIIYDILESEENIKNINDFDPYKIMRIACKSSIKSGKHLSVQEVQRLIEELKSCEMPLSCPHGRPTMIKIKSNWLEKEFFRIQA